MVRVWPFRCLHIGTLSVQGSYYDILEAMIDGLQLLSVQNSSSWGPKLQLLDLRQDHECKIICSEITIRFPSCCHSCAYSQNSTLRTEEAQPTVRYPRFDNSESEPHSALETVELQVDLSFNGTLRTQQFLSFLQRKLRQSFGSLHLCCRDLEIFNMPAYRRMLQFLNPQCINHLYVNLAHLREVNNLVAQTAHLYSLCLSNIQFTCFAGRRFHTFLNCLGKLDSLQELDLCNLYLRDRLHIFLRVLPPQMETLNLSLCGPSNKDVTILSQSSQATHLRQLDLTLQLFITYCEESKIHTVLKPHMSAATSAGDIESLSLCGLSYKDITILSQSSHVTHLRQLNLSHNQIFSEAYEPFRTRLERASGTLQHLEINNCLLTDSTVSDILPALSHCSCLHVLSFAFAFNPITMPVLMSLLQHLTSLMELRHVIYPIPLHCYREWDVPDSVDQQKSAEVQAQIMAMLQAVHRDDMCWTISSV
ncbi:hypothetical protein MC885_005800 [Smutsia gigantea]|nr:hypothetical protein MC885_005800 [Smutsia gigantea]